MTATAFQFFSFSDWPEVTGTSETQTKVAFALSETQEFHNQAEQLAAEADPQAAIVIVPLGTAGDVLWNGISIEVASIVAAVRPEAMVFCRLPQLSLDRKQTLWETVANAAPRVAITPSLRIPFVSDDLPKLAPRSRSLSKTWIGKIDSIGGSSHEGIALRAGLALIHDDLDTSHEFAQSIEGVGPLHLGDCWHAIMHRREPDYFNSKYWFRRVGTHPVANDLSRLSEQMLSDAGQLDSGWKKITKNGGWDSLAFVDLCEQVARQEESPTGMAARQVQWLEMLLLLRLCTQQLR